MTEREAMFLILGVFLGVVFEFLFISLIKDKCKPVQVKFETKEGERDDLT